MAGESSRWSTVKQTIEHGFEDFGGWIFNNKRKTVFGTLLFLFFLAIHIPKVTIDVSTKGLFHEGDDSLEKYNNFQDQFGRDQVIIAALKSDNIYDLNFIHKLNDFHREIEHKVPYLDKVTSLINVSSIVGLEIELIV